MARFLPTFLPCYLAFDHVHVLLVIKREFHVAKLAHVPKRTLHASHRTTPSSVAHRRRVALARWTCRRGMKEGEELVEVRGRVEDAMRALERLARRWTERGPGMAWSEDVLERYQVLHVQMEGWIRRDHTWTDVHVAMPKDVRANNADVLPLLLSTKPLPEMTNQETKRTQRKAQGKDETGGNTVRAKAKTFLDLHEIALRKRTDETHVDTRSKRSQGDAERRFFPNKDATRANEEERSPEEKQLVRALLLGEGLETNHTQVDVQ